MLTASFLFAKGMTEDLERALWARGITSWELARAHPEEVADVAGAARAAKLAEGIAQAGAARDAGDLAWFKANWPEKELWRLWQGYCPREQVALVDIETTGLTPGYDQITVIGLADAAQARVFVAGRPQPGDEPLERFREAIKPYRLLVTFNGVNFDVPFIERSFRDHGFRFDQPHLDLLYPARALGLTGGLKDMEKAVGIVRGDEIKDIRGGEAIQLWGQWRSGDANAYRRLTSYCKADCANLARFADAIHTRLWERVHIPHARQVDFARIKGQQQSLF
jgi:uncharacterized protein YprB with RNaseH-like and TPR domain